LYVLGIMKDQLTELGQKLVENSINEAEFSAQRGLINELFPYVYEASKRMSSRAISRWLESEGTKLSAATIAKALRNPKPYWEELWEEIEPAATIFGNAYGLHLEDVLLNHDVFMHSVAQPPTVEGTTRDGLDDSWHEIENATSKLRDEWYELPESAREACLAYANLNLEEAEAVENMPAVKEETK
jgi:hypothetical protein